MSHYIWQDTNWPLFTWRSNCIIEHLSKCNYQRGQFLGKLASIGMELGQEAQAEVLVAEVMQTSAIEGQVLDLDSVRSSVAKRLGSPKAGLSKPDRYTEGLVDVLLDATINYNHPLTAERLHGWQAALFPTGYSGIHQITVGEFRGDADMQVVSGPIGKEKIHYQAPPGKRVPKEMKQFLNWWHHKPLEIDGLLRAAIAGFWFVSIHPYEDGNGRLARAIADMALAQDEKNPIRYYSLSAQIMEERQSYYQVLEECQKGGLDISQWLLWFIGCFERAIGKSKKLISLVMQKARFWDIHRHKQLTKRQYKVINRLLDAGPKGFEGGLTTRKYVGMTRASRATSYREITDLVNKKILEKNPQKGRSVNYDLIWPADR